MHVNIARQRIRHVRFTVMEGLSHCFFFGPLLPNVSLGWPGTLNKSKSTLETSRGSERRSPRSAATKTRRRFCFYFVQSVNTSVRPRCSYKMSRCSHNSVFGYVRCACDRVFPAPCVWQDPCARGCRRRGFPRRGGRGRENAA